MILSYAFAPSATYSGTSGSLTIVLSREEYDRLRQFEFFQNIRSATHASSSGMRAYNAFPQKPMILDLGASSHMTDIKKNCSIKHFQ